MAVAPLLLERSVKCFEDAFIGECVQFPVFDVELLLSVPGHVFGIEGDELFYWQSGYYGAFGFKIC
jgi:hypothetical protein